MNIKSYNEYINESAENEVRPTVKTTLNEKQIREYLIDGLGIDFEDGFIIYPDLKVSAVHCDIYLTNSKLINNKLPIQFTTLRSIMTDSDINLTNLIGFPDKVLIDVNCSNSSNNLDRSNNSISSLLGGPTWVGGDFNVNMTKIKSLKYAPKYVGGGFYCSNTLITSLEGCPVKIGGTFNCWNCSKLRNLIGGPKEVGNNEGYICSDCNLTSLEGAPEIVPNTFACHGNKLKNFIGGPKKVGHDYSCSQMKNNSLISFDGFATEVGKLIELNRNNNVSFDGFPIKLISKISTYLDADVRRNLYLYIDKVLDEDYSIFYTLGPWAKADRWPGDLYEKWSWLFEIEAYKTNNH